MTSTDALEALAPLREALLATARREAEAAIAEATDRAEKLVSEAIRAAEQRVAAARAQGTADASRAVVGEEIAARSQARSAVLAAQRWFDDELREQARARISALRDDPGYARLRAALERQGRARLGDAATCREPDGGGVVVDAPGRRIDASLDALARWAVDNVDGADAEAVA